MVEVGRRGVERERRETESAEKNGMGGGGEEKGERKVRSG